MVANNNSHMEDGIGRLLGCYVLYLSLFNIVGNMVSLDDIDWCPEYNVNVKALSDSSTTNTNPIRYPQTESFASITSTVLNIAKSAANYAISTPYQTTIIS